MASLTGGIVINSDAVRKKLAGLDVFDKANSKAGEGIYTPEMTEKVYATMKQKAMAIALAGMPVILDGTFYSNELRRNFYQFFKEKKIDVQFVYTQCPEEELIRRIERREKDTSISDADVEIFMQLKDRFEKPEDDVTELYVVNSNTSIEDIRNQLQNIIS
ncbi:MAG: AAA family ATPase [Spirochaetes bacterium]|nr:AAA family ATPase [Spirochaetota bacterium]